MAYSTPWPICDACRAIPLELFTANPEADLDPHQLWPSFAAFADSASRGCHSCFLLFEAVREPFKTRLRDVPVYLESIPPADGSSARCVNVTVDTTAIPDREQWTADLLASLTGFKYTSVAEVKYALDAKDVPTTARHFKDLISLYADDDGAYRYAKQSLHKCLQEHEKTCNRVIFPHTALTTEITNVVNIVHGDHGLVVAPTRLIDVGSAATNDPIRLVDGQQCLYKGGHLTLSYCWGNVPKNAPWVLTRSSMGSFAQEVPMNVLPQTLHDAIIWTRELGERYIWIDSMCIIQDDKEDWQREAARMASIYGSATMTIVAASSSVYGGMSDRRNPLRNCAVALQLARTENSQQTVYILPNGQKAAVAPLPVSEYRSWCYQEDLLSSRIMKNTRTALKLECCGDSKTGRPQALQELNKHPTFRWYTLWYQYIEKYSYKGLTYPADKLAAFHGIAMAKAARAYHAGVLESDIWTSLLWCRDENQIRARPGGRYGEYVAPSWSWASLDIPVLFYEANGRQWRNPQLTPVSWDPELHRIETTAASYFSTGAVTAGHVDLSAYAVLARTGPVEPFLFNTKHGAHTRGRRNVYHPISKEALGLVVFDVADEAQDDILVYTILLHTVNMGLWEMNGTCALGLALKMTRMAKGGLECTRIGYVQFTAAFTKYCHRRRLTIL